MTLIIFILVLAVLILAHEFGHFIAAKKIGMKVEEFGIGFPPTLFSFKPKKSETRYSINLIPFGGFVKILGENANEDIPDEEKNRAFGEKSALKRAVVLVAGVFFNFLLAWLLITAGLSIGAPASPADFPEKYVKNVNLTIMGVAPQSPASEAGLRPGDIIFSIELGEENLENPASEAMLSFINRSEGEELNLGILRGGDKRFVPITAKEGIIMEGYAIGISMADVGLVKLPLFISFWEALKLSVNFLWVILISLAGFIANAIRGAADLSQVTGPVGIVGLVGDAAKIGFSSLLYFTAVISLHLSVINLLPLPALDGGRLLFVAIEKIKGSKINPKVEIWVNGIGFALLILLMIVVTWNDIARLF